MIWISFGWLFYEFLKNVINIKLNFIFILGKQKDYNY